MISGATQRRILCCWSECDRAGDTDHEARVGEPGRILHYIFCSESHLLLWAHSHVKMGFLPSGSKSRTRFI